MHVALFMYGKEERAPKDVAWMDGWIVNMELWSRPGLETWFSKLGAGAKVTREV